MAALSEYERAVLRRARNIRSPKQLPRLIDWVPVASPTLKAPRYLAPIAEHVERVLVEPVEFAFSVPPRFGKTTLLWHAIAWLLLQEPRLRLLFCASELRRAEREIARAKAAFVRAGGALGAINRAEIWETAAGGYVRAAGLNGPIIGDGFHTVFVDDPHRGRLEAESRTIREAVVTRFLDDVYTRREPANAWFRGTSFILVHTRWHVEDLIGVVSKTADGWRPFQYINLPYEDEAGTPLAPEMWPPEQVANYRRNRRNWESVFMGRPVPSGGAVFDGAHLYELDSVPAGCRYAIGVDLAYSERTSADFSVAVVLARGSDERFYVVDVVRRQVRAPEFVASLKALCRDYPGAPMLWYASGPETGVADFFRSAGVPLTVKPPKGDKRVRALGVSDAWNEGRVLMPRRHALSREVEWVAEFADEVLSFTGLGDAHDDQVDALAAAYDMLDSSTALVVPARPSSNRIRPYGGERTNPYSRSNGARRP